MRNVAMILLAGALLVGGPLAIGEARAELEVKRSTAPGMKTGYKVADEKQLSVPNGTEVEFFKLPAGPSYTVKGPYQGTLADYTNPCPWWKAATGSCKKDDQLDTGGTRGVTGSEVPGATRGIRKPQPQQ
jgi:hypothetical protein